MNYFIKGYYQILLRLDKYKKDFISLNKKETANHNYDKYVDEIDNLLLQKYIKFEELLSEVQKY